MGRTFETLTISEIVEINRRMIQSFGGVFFEGDRNLANSGSLEFVLAEIQGPLFDTELYPSIMEKAAAIGWRIIAGHIFHDGNKRTGMEACRQFLDLNGYTLRIDREAVTIALKIATGEADMPEFACWVEEHSTKRE
jgi:death on curing protein